MRLTLGGIKNGQLKVFGIHQFFVKVSNSFHFNRLVFAGFSLALLTRRFFSLFCQEARIAGLGKFNKHSCAPIFALRLSAEFVKLEQKQPAFAPLFKLPPTRATRQHDALSYNPKFQKAFCVSRLLNKQAEPRPDNRIAIERGSREIRTEATGKRPSVQTATHPRNTPAC